MKLAKEIRVGRPGKRSVLAGGLVLATTVVALLATQPFSSDAPSAAELKQADVANVGRQTLAQRFALLSRRPTKTCALADVNLDTIAIDGRLQGSCCSKMVFERYAQQVNGLRAYAAVDEIPADPYDMSVTFARRLMSLDASITLSAEQQATYKRAVKLSEEHGPCCCQCWRWRAYEGQGKALIARQRYTAAQIATVWGLEDGCGGSGDA